MAKCIWPPLWTYYFTLLLVMHPASDATQIKMRCLSGHRRQLGLCAHDMSSVSPKSAALELAGVVDGLDVLPC